MADHAVLLIAANRSHLRIKATIGKAAQPYMSIDKDQHLRIPEEPSRHVHISDFDIDTQGQGADATASLSSSDNTGSRQSEQPNADSGSVIINQELPEDNATDSDELQVLEGRPLIAGTLGSVSLSGGTTVRAERILAAMPRTVVPRPSATNTVSSRLEQLAGLLGVHLGRGPKRDAISSPSLEFNQSAEGLVVPDQLSSESEAASLEVGQPEEASSSSSPEETDEDGPSRTEGFEGSHKSSSSLKAMPASSPKSAVRKWSARNSRRTGPSPKEIPPCPADAATMLQKAKPRQSGTTGMASTSGNGSSSSNSRQQGKVSKQQALADEPSDSHHRASNQSNVMDFLSKAVSSGEVPVSDSSSTGNSPMLSSDASAEQNLSNLRRPNLSSPHRQPDEPGPELHWQSKSSWNSDRGSNTEHANATNDHDSHQPDAGEEYAPLLEQGLGSWVSSSRASSSGKPTDDFTEGSENQDSKSQGDTWLLDKPHTPQLPARATAQDENLSEDQDSSSDSHDDDEAEGRNLQDLMDRLDSTSNTGARDGDAQQARAWVSQLIQKQAGGTWPGGDDSMDEESEQQAPEEYPETDTENSEAEEQTTREEEEALAAKVEAVRFSVPYVNVTWEPLVSLEHYD